MRAEDDPLVLLRRRRDLLPWRHPHLDEGCIGHPAHGPEEGKVILDHHRAIPVPTLLARHGIQADLRGKEDLDDGELRRRYGGH